MTINFEGKVAIVTGAGGGLGRCHALDLAKRGAKVVVNDLGGNVDGSDDGSLSAAEKVVEEITAAGGEAMANGASVTDVSQVEEMVKETMDKWGRIDILVNNAGILRDKSFAKMTEEDFNAVLDVHLKGTFFVCQPAFIHMKENGYGRFVNVASPSGLFGNFGQSNYGAAKMGIVGLTNIIAIEGAKYNINANVLAPNATTRMTEELFGEEFGKLFKVEQVTPLVVYLASEACKTTHEIFSAGAGRYARIGINTHVGYVNPDATADDISENIEDIRTIKDGIYPMNNADELVIIQKALQGE